MTEGQDVPSYHLSNVQTRHIYLYNIKTVVKTRKFSRNKLLHIRNQYNFIVSIIVTYSTFLQQTNQLLISFPRFSFVNYNIF